MPRPPKTSPEVWDSHKKQIHDYYIAQNKTLKDTMELMKIIHDFNATQREYVRRLDQWQYSKNLKKEDYQLVHKRKHIGKETQIYVLGQPMQPKKMRRGLARHKFEPDNSLNSIIFNNSWTRGVGIRTPSPEPSLRIFLSNVPWFQFQRTYSHALRSVVDEFIPSLSWAYPDSLSPNADSHGVTSMQNARTLLQSVLGLPDHNEVDLTPLILNRLETLLPRKHEENYKMVSNEPFLLLIQSFIYLSSNNQLTQMDIDSFTTWILDSGIVPFFERFVKQHRSITSLTMEIFLNRLLLSAVRLEKEALVAALLVCKVDPNFNNQQPFISKNIYSIHSMFINETITPLQLATIKQNYRICSLLLRQGADVNATSLHMPFCPLELAISVHQGNSHIARTMVTNGANTNVSCELEVTKVVTLAGGFGTEFVTRYTQKTLLMKATEVQNFEIASLLLSYGLSFNEPSPFSGITAFQIAVMKNDLELVNMCLEHGAEINLSGELENSAKKYLANQLKRLKKEYKKETRQYSDKNQLINHLFNEFESNCEWGALQSPIEIATQQSNHSMVERLLVAGAEINHQVHHSKVWKHIPMPGNISEESIIYRRMKEVTRIRFQTALHYAVKNKNLALTKLLLEKGGNSMVNSRNGLGSTPLQLACGLEEDAEIEDDSELEDDGEDEHRHQWAITDQVGIQLAGLLIDSGANANSQAGPTNGRTAIQAAAETGDQKLVGLLLEAGADVNAAPSLKNGITALEAAVYFGDQELVELLLDAGADVNATPSQENGMTVLEAAALAGNVNLILCLMNHGAITPSNVWWIALYAAALNGDASVTEQLLNQGAIDINALYPEDDRLEIKQSILQAGVRGGNVDVVQALLNSGADMNQDVQGETALCTAVQEEDVQILELLLLWGADPNLGKAKPLAIAASKGLVDITRSLLYADADIDGLSESPGEDTLPLRYRLADVGTALYFLIYKYGNQRKFNQKLRNDLEGIAWLLLSSGAHPFPDVVEAACEWMDSSFVEELIRRGANVNIPNGRGLYPIHGAMLSNNINIVRLLLNEGADVNVPAPSKEYGSNVLEMAIEYGRGGLIRLLIDAGAQADKGQFLPRVILSKLFDLAWEWINEGADVNGLSNVGPLLKLTPLQAAAHLGHMDLVQLLLKKGANINPSPGERSSATALQWVVQKGDFNMVKLLIELGADINAKGASERSVINGAALEIAARHGRLDIAHLLLENDRQVENIESRCKDAATVATENGHFVLARILRDFKAKHEAV